jgi:hypothetical protein
VGDDARICGATNATESSGHGSSVVSDRRAEELTMLFLSLLGEGETIDIDEGGNGAFEVRGRTGGALLAIA